MSKRPIALVTGATSGIGKACVAALSTSGYEVIAVGRRVDILKAICSEYNAKAVPLDIKNLSALKDELGDVEINVLVNNAGTIPSVSALHEMPHADIDDMISVNLTAPIHLTRIVLPNMIKNGSGHIFFTGSTAGQTPFPSVAVYGATKAAISSFAASLRCDISGSNVRVTEIVAGRVQTEIYNNAIDAEARQEMYTAFDAVQPKDVAEMLMNVIKMPQHVDITRFDILPTAQYVGGGGFSAKES